MATTLPRPARTATSNLNGPPTVPLPSLPIQKTRKSTGGIAIPRSATSSPRIGLRAPSTTYLPPAHPAPTSALPTPRAVSAALFPTKTLRKTVSIQALPQPSRSDSGRVHSLPASPLGADPLKHPGPSSFKKNKSSSIQSYYSASTPSLLNSSGEGKSVSALRMSDGLISVSSPPQSRSSSAQDSYSTSATTYDDPPDPSSATTTSSSASHSLDRHPSSHKLDGKGNVLVSVRVRPDASGNDHSKTEGEWMVDGRRSLISYRGRDGGEYYYDNVFAAHDDNSRVYDCIAKRLVRRVMEGYHGTVFAYGMTGTGKTFSMQGTASSPGVIPLAITDIFSYIRETPSREFLLRVSYLEIYNEKIHDLLSMPISSGVGGSAVQEEIKLREDSKRGVYATPLKEEIVQSPTQLLRVIARGDQARRTASTQFNARSSRSHAVVQIVVESRERISATADSKRAGMLPGGVRVSTLSLIDLAGSEKAAETKERRTEGSHINKSLLTLGTVIAKLSEFKEKDGKPADKEGKHLPYRDSKLTRLLQGALSGNSLVSILCTIQIGAAGSPAAANMHTTETINTLKFASRAKNNIVSHAKRAEEALGAGGDGGARVLLERYRMEIVELRRQLEIQAKTGGTKASPAVTDGVRDSSQGESEDEEEARVRDAEEERAREKEQEQRHEEQMLEMQLARTALKERIDHLNRLILCSKSIGVNSSGSYSSLGMNPRFSQMSAAPSARSSMGASSVGSARPAASMARSSSVTSASSTVGRRSSSSGAGEPAAATSSSATVVGGGGAAVAAPPPPDDDDSLGEFGDGIASLAAQNRALQADVADKNRYIATLEKRLLQARRASSSRTSIAFSAPNKAIMVGEDHSVATLLKEKDAEIADLRARIDDKDRMLAALRSAARSRDSAEARSPSTLLTSSLSNGINGNTNPTSLAATESPSTKTATALPSRTRGSRVAAGDEDLSILDEMIQDRVEKGQIIRGIRGSVRVANDRKLEAVVEPPVSLDATRQSPTLGLPITS